MGPFYGRPSRAGLLVSTPAQGLHPLMRDWSGYGRGAGVIEHCLGFHSPTARTTMTAPEAPQQTKTASPAHRLIESLIASAHITPAAATDVRDGLRSSGSKTLIKRLLDLGVKSDVVADCISRVVDGPLYPSSEKPSAIARRPADIPPPAKATKVLQSARDGDNIEWVFCDNHVLYVVNPFDLEGATRVVGTLRRDLAAATGAQPQIRVGIISMGWYLQLADPSQDADPTAGQYEREFTQILTHAVRRNASDIHFEPGTDEVRVRLREDSVMRNYKSFTHEAYLKLANVILARTNKGKAGTYLEALDDMFVFKVPPARTVKIRVMMIPVVVQERTESLPCFCLRILGNNIERLGLRDLGIPNTDKNPQLTRLQLLLERKNGLILISGPTGSGKTTTLTALMSEMQRTHPDKCRYTVEDPVEMNMAGVNHVQVNEEAGLTFARAIKSFLRGDPDEILIGEIRDGTVGGHALTAAITGHLAFATVHTNSSIQTIARLIDMGCDPYIVADAVRAATAQRLARKLCPACAVEARWGEMSNLEHAIFKAPDSQMLRLWYQSADRLYGDLDCYPKSNDQVVRIAMPGGCATCNGSGYKGRSLICELFEVTPTIVDLIARRASSTVLRRQALKEGFKEMWQHGASEIWVKRSTTFEEMISALGEREPVTLDELPASTLSEAA